MFIYLFTFSLEFLIKLKNRDMYRLLQRWRFQSKKPELTTLNSNLRKLIDSSHKLIKLLHVYVLPGFLYPSWHISKIHHDISSKSESRVLCFRQANAQCTIMFQPLLLIKHRLLWGVVFSLNIHHSHPWIYRFWNFYSLH